MASNSRQYCDTPAQLQANMAQFSDLPSEILLLFVEQLPPTDIDAFCQLSKRIRAVAASFHSRHMDLKRRYTTRNYGEDWASNDQLANLLKDILDNPHGALYTSRLQFYNWAQSRESRSTPLIPPEAPGSQTLETQNFGNTLPIISDAIRNCVVIPEDCKAVWIQSVERGREDPLIALLLTMLPNLTELRLKHAGGVYLDDVITRIVAQSDPAFLSKLDTIELEPIAVPHGRDLSEQAVVIKKFCLLPSITTISALGYRHCGLEDISDLKLTGQNRRSQVFHMSFSTCYISPVILDDLVQFTSPLASFRYRLREHHLVEHDCTDMELWYMSLALLGYAYTTLKHLTLVTCSESYSGMGIFGSLEHFEVLEEVVADAAILLGQSMRGRFSPAEMLPSTIRYVTLRHDILEDGCFHRELLDDLLNAKEEKLPKLEFLRFISKDDNVLLERDDEVRERFIRAFSAAGIELEMPHRSDDDDWEDKMVASHWPRSKIKD